VATPTNEPVKVTSDAPVDDVVANLIQTVARKGRGFVLDLLEQPASQAGDERKVIVEVKETLRPHDEWLPSADYAAHRLNTTDSLITFAEKYGDKDKSLIFFAESGCALVVDERVGKGSREVVTLSLPTSKDWNDWGAMLNKPLEHRDLLKFLLSHESNLADPGVLMAMSSVKATSTVNYESDIRDEGKSVGVFFKTSAGDELKKFPKEFGIVLPVLEADEGRDDDAAARIRLDIQLPDGPQEKPKFSLYCSEWRATHKRRIEAEGQKLREALDGWTVVHGTYNTKQHESARPQQP
jgi:hypothetical protein